MIRQLYEYNMVLKRWYARQLYELFCNWIQVLSFSIFMKYGVLIYNTIAYSEQRFLLSIAMVKERVFH